MNYILKLRDNLKNEILETYNLDPEQADVKNVINNVFDVDNYDRDRFDVMALNQDYDAFNLKEIYLDEMTPVLRLKYLKDTGAMTDIIEKNTYGDKETRDRITGDILFAMSGFGFADYQDQIQPKYNEKTLRNWLITERENALEFVNEPYANKRMSLVTEYVQDFETWKNTKASLDNIVAIMKKRKGPSREVGFEGSTSLGPLAARITPRFKTLQEIKTVEIELILTNIKNLLNQLEMLIFYLKRLYIIFLELILY